MNSTIGNIVKSWVKVFAFGALGVIANFEWDIFSIDSTGWKAVLTGGIAALGCVIVTTIDPTDPRWGIGKAKT
jgi:hypothetical protein